MAGNQTRTTVLNPDHETSSEGDMRDLQSVDHRRFSHCFISGHFRLRHIHSIMILLYDSSKIHLFPCVQIQLSPQTEQIQNVLLSYRLL